MSKVDEAIVEINQTLAAIAPELEGLQDFLSIDDLEPDTKTMISSAIDQYTRRQRALESANVALTNLVGDGHPVLTIAPVTLSVKADLDANMASLEAALAKITTTAASTLGMTATAPEPK